MSEPKPPDDEPYRIWHRAASEMVMSAVQGETSEPLRALWQAKDFADRALAKATPLEAMLTQSLVEAIARIREAIEKESRDGPVRG